MLHLHCFSQRVYKMYNWPSTVYIDALSIGLCFMGWQPSMVLFLTAFSQTRRVLIKDPLVGPWGVVPKHFNLKPTIILCIHISTKFYYFPTLKTLSNRLRHVRTSWTSLRTSWTFLDVLILKLHKWLIYIITDFIIVLQLL